MHIKIYSQRGAKGITKFGSIEWTSEENKCIHFAEVARGLLLIKSGGGGGGESYCRA